MTEVNPNLTPSASPGETGAIAVWAAVSALLIALGVDAAVATTVAGLLGVLTPYVVKFVLWWRSRPPTTG